MTRINIVEPSQLTDEHLMAEYRELPRVFTAVGRLVEKGVQPQDVVAPDHYKMGEGHVKFFYTKLGWLWARYSLLIEELLKRDFNLQFKLYNKIKHDACQLPMQWFGNYEPTPQEIYINMARLVNRAGVNDNG